MKLAPYRKFLVALAGLLGQIVSVGLMSGNVQHYATIALAILTALGVHQVENTPAPT